jgi:simple sugar transport system permease protein
MAEVAAPPEPSARTDERLTQVGWASRLLSRPDIGAMIGALVVWLAFGYFARGVNWLGDPGNDAGWTEQAAKYGIGAVSVV